MIPTINLLILIHDCVLKNKLSWLLLHQCSPCSFSAVRAKYMSCHSLVSRSYVPLGFSYYRHNTLMMSGVQPGTGKEFGQLLLYGVLLAVYPVNRLYFHLCNWTLNCFMCCKGELFWTFHSHNSKVSNSYRESHISEA